MADRLNAYQQGKIAGANGLPESSNPWFYFTNDGKQWLVGWREATEFNNRCAAKKWRVID